MRLPEVAARLEELGKEISQLSKMIARRKPIRKAEPTSTPMSPDLARDIRAFARQHPTMSQLKIGQKFGVNQGRVSEALRGKRR
jgi:hypothetical protein